ncbi:reverse transcriptase domain-containing protein [Tanacetum coccineum]
MPMASSEISDITNSSEVQSHHQNSEEAGVSKDISGDEGSSSGGTKLNSSFITAELGDERLSSGVTKLNSIFITPEVTFTKPNRDVKELELTRQVRHRAVIRMIKGNTNRKRLREQSEQWKSNEISFPSIPGHELKTYPHMELRVQRKWSIASNRRKVGKDEVTEWLKTEIVRKVRYPTWVANPILVKKSDNSWRMCIDFKDLNKSYSKDLYPLLEIDWKIKSLMGFKYKFFLDAYKGYHQIQMAKKDEEKTTFHTNEGVFCYTKMPFGLKNAGATYQRLVKTVFEWQMGRNLEAYVDDMVIKSKTKLKMIKDVEKTRLTLKRNQSKSGKNKGCSEHALTNQPETNAMAKRKLAALNRFLSKAAERALPCIDTLKKCTNKKDFHWTIEAEELFQAMKKLIAEQPTLTAPKKEEELMVYLSAANEAVSAVLLEATGRFAKWGVELEAYDIKYASRSMIKGQVLADFLTNTMTEDSHTQVKIDGSDDTIVEGESMEEQEDKETKAPKNLKTKIDMWKLYTDGASNEHRSGAGLILIDPEGAEYSYAL